MCETVWTQTDKRRFSLCYAAFRCALKETLLSFLKSALHVGDLCESAFRRAFGNFDRRRRTIDHGSSKISNLRTYLPRPLRTMEKNNCLMLFTCNDTVIQHNDKTRHFVRKRNPGRSEPMSLSRTVARSSSAWTSNFGKSKWRTLDFSATATRVPSTRRTSKSLRPHKFSNTYLRIGRPLACGL